MLRVGNLTQCSRRNRISHTDSEKRSALRITICIFSLSIFQTRQRKNRRRIDEDVAPSAYLSCENLVDVFPFEEFRSSRQRSPLKLFVRYLREKPGTYDCLACGVSHLPLPPDGGRLYPQANDCLTAQEQIKWRCYVKWSIYSITLRSSIPRTFGLSHKQATVVESPGFVHKAKAPSPWTTFSRQPSVLPHTLL